MQGEERHLRVPRPSQPCSHQIRVVPLCRQEKARGISVCFMCFVMMGMDGKKESENKTLGKEAVAKHPLYYLSKKSRAHLKHPEKLRFVWAGLSP